MKLKNRIGELFRSAYRLTEAPPAASAGGSSSGGGTATAAPPSGGGAPAAAGGAAPAAAPTAKPGSFGLPVVPLKKLPDAVKPPTPAEGKPAATPPAQPAGAAAAQPPAGTPALDPLDAPLPKPILGRHKTWREADEAARRSEQEGLRLYQENRTLLEKHQKEIADRDSRLAALQAELETARTTPPFKELNEEEYNALAKENPGAAAKYVAEKMFRDRDAQARKEQAARDVQDRQRYEENIRRTIDSKIDEMQANEAEFPQYREMQPVMDRLIEMTAIKSGDSAFSPLTGHSWTPDFLYLAAMGHAYLQAIKAGKATQDGAAEAARLKAEQDAAAGRAAGAGDGQGSGAAAPDAEQAEDKAWRERVLKSQPRRFLGDRRS